MALSPDLGYIAYRPPTAPLSSGSTPASACGCGGSCGGSSGPVGSTVNPNTTPAAPIGASSGITSPQPQNQAGFLGFLGFPRIGQGWPNGGTATPPPAFVGAQSSSQPGGAPGSAAVSSGQGFNAAALIPSGNFLTWIVLGVVAYVIYKGIES